MKDNQILKDYLLIKEITNDAFGKSFLARKNSDQSDQEYIVVRLHDYISQNSDNHDLIKQYTTEISRSSVPNILRPVDLIFNEENILLVYPYIQGKNLKTVIDNLERGQSEFPFKTVAELVLKLAVIVDMGSMVILNKQPSYHGFLIPENILIGYDGEIYLKYYGMLPFISSSSYSLVKENYKIWLAPELLQSDEIHYRSEIYYLGHIVYRILTGKYFPPTPGVFEQSVTNISFNRTIPSTDTRFLGNLLEFFRLTLNPEVDKRIDSFDKFTSYISEKFSVTNTYSINTDLSRILQELFLTRDKTGDTVPVSELLKEEDDPAKTIARRRFDPEELRGKIGKKKKSKGLRVILALIIMSLIIFMVIYITNSKKENQTEKNNRIEESTPVQDQQKNYSIQELSDENQKKENPVQNEEMRSKDSAREKEGADNQKLPNEKLITDGNKSTGKSEDRLIKNQLRKNNKGKGGYSNNKNKSPASSDILTEPIKIEGTNPVLNYDLKQYHKSGQDRVSVKLLIDKKGKVGKVEMITDADSKIVREIIKSIYKWKFSPATRNGTAVKTEISLPVFLKFESKSKKVLKEDSSVVELKDLTQKPVKKSGNMVFSKVIKRNYIGRRRTIITNLLINSSGKVEQVKFTSDLPVDLKENIKENIFKWVYSSPLKGDQKVKTWVSEAFKIEIR